MNIGRLDRFCRIERKQVAKDPVFNTEIITWVLVATAHCHFDDVSATRALFVQDGIALAQNPVKVLMRYRTDIDKTMRLVVQRPNTMVYNIIAGPVEVGNKIGIEMMVEEATS